MLMPHSAFHWRLCLSAKLISNLCIIEVKGIISVKCPCVYIFAHDRLNFKHRAWLEGRMKSPVLLPSASHTHTLSFYPFITHCEMKMVQNPQPISVCVGRGCETCRSHCRFRLMAYMWFSNQAAKKHSRVCLLSINRRCLYPLIILVKGNMGFIWHPLSLASFPSSYVKAVFCSWCTNVPVYDLVPICHNRYCLENGTG